VKRRDLLIGVAITIALLLEASLTEGRENTVVVNLALYAPIGALFIAQPLRPFEFTLALIAAMSLVSLGATDVVGMTTTLLVLLVAVFRAAYASKFSKPRVVSALGHGGYPSVAFAGNRPVIAFSDGDAVFGYTRLPSRHPDLTPACLTESALSADELRRDGKVTTTIRCSEDCFVGSQARLTTGRRGESVGQIISRQHRDPVVLRAGVPMTVTYELSDKGKTALADTGRAEAKVIVTMTNRSGASRTTRRVLELR